MYKAAKLIDWTGYDANQAAVDAMVMQTSSVRLQQRAIQENPNYEQLVNLGISQEQAKKKATGMPEGDKDKVISKLQLDVLKLKKKTFKDKTKPKGGGAGAAGGGGGGGSTCSSCCIPKCSDPGGTNCFA